MPGIVGSPEYEARYLQDTLAALSCPFTHVGWEEGGTEDEHVFTVYLISEVVPVAIEITVEWNPAPTYGLKGVSARIDSVVVCGRAVAIDPQDSDRILFTLTGRDEYRTADLIQQLYERTKGRTA